jgi:hypothetical protein
MFEYKNKQQVDSDRIKKILKPYWTPFIKDSYISKNKDQIFLQSNLGVDSPWYCDSTGHMNAVELTLAFNQMMYVSIGQSLVLGWIPGLKGLGEDYFMQKYWPDFLITKNESIFKAPLNVSSFCGTLRIKKSRPLSNHLLFELDVTVKPGSDEFPPPGEVSHAYSKMTLVIKNYKQPPSEI